MTSGIKILIVFIVAMLLLGTLAVPAIIPFSILTDFYEFILSAMKSFDWLVPYGTQKFIFWGFLITEVSLLAFNLVRWIIELTAGKAK